MTASSLARRATDFWWSHIHDDEAIAAIESAAPVRLVRDPAACADRLHEVAGGAR